MPAGERHWWGDDFPLSVVGAAFVDDANLINGKGVAGGNQLVVFSEQALSSSKGAELVAGVEAVAVHGVIGLFAVVRYSAGVVPSTLGGGCGR